MLESGPKWGPSPLADQGCAKPVEPAMIPANDSSLGCGNFGVLESPVSGSYLSLLKIGVPGRKRLLGDKARLTVRKRG